MGHIMTTTSAYWLNVKGFAVYLPNDSIPFGTAEQWHYQEKSHLKIAEYKGCPVYLLLDIDDDLEYQSLRSQLHRPVEEFELLNRAVGLQHFFYHQRYCGRCGHTMRLDDEHIAVYCDGCHYQNFPRISPCVIVGVYDKHRILLAHHARHKQPVYTVLAGFVEMGETLEHAVHREVYEESGIQVKNLQYVASQPWSFPNSLMVGFLAEYAGGEIQVQEEEISDAQWFDVRQPFPVLLPEQGTIARRLVDMMIEQCQ